jgi:signal transduction histidine kinase
MEDLASRLFGNGDVGEHLTHVIHDSWVRSRQFGVEPHRLRVQRLDTAQLGRVQLRARALLEAAEPVLALVHATLRDEPHMVAVADADGMVIRFFASDPRESVINFFEGASWNERDIGTNGIGTALSARQPVLVAGPQHFVRDYHHWTCIGVPLCSPDGQVLGALDLSVRNDRLSAHTWGWTLSLVKSVEAQLARAYPARIVDLDEIESIDDPARLRAAVRRLLQERDQLDVWDRRKDGAVATVSHELKNPLSAMALSLDLLERSRGIPGRVGEVSERLRHQVKRLAKVVGDIGDVAQVKNGALVIHRESIDLNTVLSSAAEVSRPQMDDLHHTLVVCTPPRPLVVDGDPERLEQVFTNLLGNAAKYTPPGGTVVLEAEELAGEARIRVRDNGIGIPPEDLDRIFAEFARVARPDGDPGGLGIGLAVVRNIVRLHGGMVTARSAGHGTGSEFEVVLPLATRAR